MYTIKSTSPEGEYYLVNHWNRFKAFWVTKDRLNNDMLFKREQDAKASLTKLLEVMPEYKTDEFEIIQMGR